MLPSAHLSRVPSPLQVKTGRWSGMQPPSTQTSPPLQVLPVPHGSTQCSWTHVVPLAQALPPLPQGVGLPVHTPFDVSHA